MCPSANLFGFGGFTLGRGGYKGGYGMKGCAAHLVNMQFSESIGYIKACVLELVQLNRFSRVVGRVPEGAREGC